MNSSCLFSIGFWTTAVLSASTAGAIQKEAVEQKRLGYIVDVQLPIVGTRDESVQRQITKIAAGTRSDQPRPVVVLNFTSSSGSTSNPEAETRPNAAGRGSQFERSLALARFLTSPAAAKVRLVAYLPESVEGHAVLSVLACEEIVAAANAELGRAAVDEPVDETVRSAYLDVASRRGTLSEAVVLAMLDPAISVIRIETADGDVRLVSSTQANQLREQGKILREETLWSGGSLAAFNGQRMRQNRWIAHVVDSPDQLAVALETVKNLRRFHLAPETWKPILVELSRQLPASRVNQIIRGLDEQIEKNKVNLIIVRVQDVQADMRDSVQLANYLARLDSELVYSVGVIAESTHGAGLLAAFVCDEVILLGDVQLGFGTEAAGQTVDIVGNRGNQSSLLELEQLTSRPATWMGAAIDEGVTVKEYVNQKSGERRALADWELPKLADSAQWLVKETVHAGGKIDPALALRYELITSELPNDEAVLKHLGLEQPPENFAAPWLDMAMQQVLSQGWLPRLLIMIGFMAMAIELGSPGLGAGGFIAAICFLGFFWIEGLNGNVAWLEVLLFFGGLLALIIETFVLPGFGVFGIGGMVMLLASVVLASQTFIWPANSSQLSIVAHNLFWVSVSALFVMIGLVVMRKHIEQSPMMRWMTLEPSGFEDVEELSHRESSVHWEHLLGQDGLTTTRLNPAGKAQFGKEIVNVLGSGRLLDEGQKVRVIEVRGNTVVVEAIYEG